MRSSKKKGKKQKKAPKKKPASTQDKLSQLIQQKTLKAKANGSGLDYKAGAPPKDAIERACCMKEELLAKIERLG